MASRSQAAMTSTRREPLVGYNHNLRYKSRIYHVQTEDSGLDAPHIDSHLFFQGTILSSRRTDYSELARDPDHTERVVQLMREQHKELMRELLRGELDAKIAAVLGSVSPRAEEQQRIRRYRHDLRHAGRLYRVETSFYATVVTDSYWERVLVDTVRQDCRKVAPAGSREIEARAQQQHKRALRRLRDGELDAKIVSLLGSLEPPTEQRGDAAKLRRISSLLQSFDDEQAETAPAGSSGSPGAPQPTRTYRHRVRHHEGVYEAITQIHGTASRPHATSELYCGEMLLTSTRTEGAELGGDELRRAAQRAHKRLLRELRDGMLDDVIELMAELQTS